MKLQEKIDFTGGVIVFDKFIDLEKSICEQENELTEDMFQVVYENNITLDIGWISEIDCNGNFRIYLVKDQDWENPIFFLNPKILMT